MPAVLAQAKPFAGVTLNGAAFQHGYHAAIKELLPEFEQATGIKVNFDLQAFPVYNQRMDLELSTTGSGYDFCNITFPFSGRWVGSKWLTPLDEFVKDPNITPASFDPADFLTGSQAPFVGPDGATYGYSWLTGVQMLGAARADLIEKAGMKMPQTLDEFMAVCVATHSNDTAAYVNDKLHNWEFPPFLLGFGGKVLKNAPTDITPVLDSPEAIKAADYYATLLRKYAPQGVLSFTDDQALRLQMTGRANMRTQTLEWLLTLGKSPDSRVRDTVRYSAMPAGPAGAFPGVNSQAYAIPAGSKQKRAAWEFIKWAVSKEMVLRLALEKAQVGVARKSVLADPAVKAAMTVNGQDLSLIFINAVEEAGKRGYMRYRTLPVFPQVGEKINRAIERIATGQGTAQEAMVAANKEAIDDLKKAGAL